MIDRPIGGGDGGVVVGVVFVVVIVVVVVVSIIDLVVDRSSIDAGERAFRQGGEGLAVVVRVAEIKKSLL